MRGPTLLVVLLISTIWSVDIAHAMSGLNCFGPGQFFEPGNQTYFPDNPPLFMNGNPNNPNLYASMTMPVNFTVALIGDQGTEPAGAGAVLQMLLNEQVQAIIHAGDFDYIDNPHVWSEFINQYLPADFPYFAILGNHDCVRWAGSKGYQQIIYDRLKNIGADLTCLGEVGLNMVCSYKGLTIVMSSYGTAMPSCVDYCGYCPPAGGQAAFIERAFRSFPGMWRLCAWHKNHQLMQVGTKPIEVGLPVYDSCRKFGAIIHTAHEHSYCRSHAMSSFTDLKVANTNNTIQLKEGQTFTFVSGLAGWHLRPFDGDLYQNPWWASAWSLTNNVTFGGMICKFNYNGQLNKAWCYTKLIDGRIIDEFYLLTDFPEPDTIQSCTPTVKEYQAARAEADVEENLATGELDCATDDPYVNFDQSSLVGLRFVKVAIDPTDLPAEVYLEWTAAMEPSANNNITFIFHGEQSGNSKDINCYHKFDLSLRNKTTASVSWTLSTDPSFGKGGIVRTPNLAPIVHEIVAQPGWKSGNAVNFLITTPVGSRTVWSYEGDRCGSSTLIVTQNAPPTCLSFQRPPPVAPSGGEPTAQNPEPAGLLPPQIAGIVFGSAAFVALVIIVIALYKRCRTNYSAIA